MMAGGPNRHDISMEVRVAYKCRYERQGDGGSSELGAPGGVSLEAQCPGKRAGQIRLYFG